MALALALAIAPLVVVIGHRGAPAELPESTLAGFARALDSAALVELDVRATRDDVLVVHHDAHVSARCTRPGGSAHGAGKTRAPLRIRDAPFAELRALDCGAADPAHPAQRALRGAQIASLDEVLALLRARRPDARVLIELKADDAPAPDALARLLIATLDRARARGRVIVESFDPALVAAVRYAAPDVPRGLLCATCDARTLRRAHELGARIVSPAHDAIDRAFVDAAHARGLGVCAWTANDPASWTRLRTLGVDAIVTDDPRALRRAIEAR